MDTRFLFGRIMSVLLAAFFLSFSIPEVVFAEENVPETVVPAAKEAEAFITGISPVQIPFASDETEQGQIYFAASAGSRTVRSVSPRKPAFLHSDLCFGFESFTKAESGTVLLSGVFDDLFVIHYIHNQDGAKG